LAAEQSFYRDRQCRGKRMIGFRRWVGMDSYLRAIVVWADGARLFLDEEESRLSGTRRPPERDFSLRWY
jgi:hypothetical protein